MNVQLENIKIDDLPYVENDLNFAQKVSLSFLLFGEQHATYILQKLLALMRMPPADQLNSDILRLYAQINPDKWQVFLVEALCIINARQILRKLGLNWNELRLHYLPHIQELSLHIHPLLKAMYFICEQLTIVQTGRLVLDINEKLDARRQGDQKSLDEPLRFYDFNYLEIFLLDWLSRRHLQLGDIQAVGSNVQILIEYFKFKEFYALAALLIQTYNTNAAAESHPAKGFKRETVDAQIPSPNQLDSVAPVLSNVNSAQSQQQKQMRSDAIQVQRENAGILLIINQYMFHRDVAEELQPYLPSANLAKRQGTNVDKSRLDEVFSALGYTVESHDNVDHMEMISLIRGACSRSMLRDSLIICILSHGFEGAVYGCDSIPVSIIDIQNVLCADENLHEKPKLLIIQACQQNEKKKQTRDVNARTSSALQHGNLVVAMSTVPGYVALRHSVQGSWFIQTFCDTVTQYSDREHVLDILTTTIGEVSKKRGDKDEKMVPLLSSTLKQKVYFPNHAP